MTNCVTSEVGIYFTNMWSSQQLIRKGIQAGYHVKNHRRMLGIY